MIISTALINILQSAIYDIGKKSFSALEDNHPFSISISKICKEFSSIENLEKTFEQFLSNEIVMSEIQTLYECGQDIKLDDLVEILCQKTSFYMGDDTENVGQKILVRFFEVLFGEILKSEDGHVVMARGILEASEMQKVEHAKTQRGIEKLAEQMSHLSQTFNPLDTSVSVETSQKISDFLKKRIDEAKILLGEGKHKTAKQIYLNIVKDIEAEKISDKTLLFRAHNNIGSCDLAMGSDILAADSFLRAHCFLPDDVKSQANAGLGHCLKGELPEALQLVNQALTQKPDDPYVLSIKANILCEMGEHEEAIKLFDNVEMTVECYQALGFVYLQMGKYGKACQCARDYLSISNNNPHACLLLGQALFQQVDNRIKSKKLLPSEVSSEDVLLAREAKDSFTKGIDSLRSHELSVDLVRALTNRAAIFIMLGEFNDASADCEEALRIDENNQTVLLNKAIAAFLSNNYSEAVNVFKKLMELKGKTDYYLSRLAISYIADGSPEEAINLLEGEKLSVELEAILVESYMRNQDYGKAKNKLDELMLAYPENSEVFGICSEYYKLVGDDSKFKEFLEKAIDCADESHKKIFKIMLADYYYRKCHEYASASKIYEEYVNPEIDSPQLRCYLSCLYNVGRYGDSLNVIQSFKKNNEPDEFLLELEAATHQALNNLEVAQDIYFSLFKKYSQKLKYLIYRGKCLFRMGKAQEAVQLFEKAKEKVKDAPEELMALADSFDFVGDTKTAIELAYQALTQKGSNPDFHKAYIRLFLRREQKKDNNIEDKYIKAFQKSISSFNELFPEEKGLKKIKVSDNFKEIFELVDEYSEKAEILIQQFKENNFPLYMLSKCRGRDCFTTWAFVIASPGMRLWTCTGLIKEIIEERSLVEMRGEIVVDIFSLFTFCYLKLLSHLTKMFSRIHITQSVQDELIVIISDMQMGVGKGIKTIGKIGDKYVKEDISADDVKYKLGFLNEIKDFIKDKLVGLNKEYDNKDIKLKEIVTAQAVDMFLLSRHKRIPICCDDRAAIFLGKNEYSIQAFSSYYVLEKMLDLKLINVDEFCEKVIELLKLSYCNIPVSANVLMYALKKHNYKIDYEVEVILKVLENPETIEQGVINVVMEAIFQIWFSPILYGNKLLVLDVLLRSITLNRSIKSVASKLKKGMVGRFNSLKIKLPIQSREILEGVDNWVRAQTIIT